MYSCGDLCIAEYLQIQSFLNLHFSFRVNFAIRQMPVIIRKELVGSSTKKSAVVETVARVLALNRTGKINYNIDGVKDNIGFVSVTEKFVDNFVLRIIVPEGNTANGKSNQFVGSQNRKIRELLKVHGLEKCEVKAIVFGRVHPQPHRDILERTPDLKMLNHTEDSIYYAQDFKIATPNLDYSEVMAFVRSSCYNDFGFFLKDVDVTLDFAGSFEKQEIVSYLVKHMGFRLQGEDDFTATRTVVDNDCMVGRNCMTFMEEIDGIVVRQKIYNKMVQSLECKSVRSSLGAHWKDWVCQQGTRLAKARDLSTDRGLTRAEATFYLSEGNIPDDDFIESVLNRIIEYIPKDLVYSTPFSAMWTAYCSTLQHSLVCVDRKENLGLVVNTYNELTKNISGHLHENWSEKEGWCLQKLTFNGNLPLDVIDVNVIIRSLSTANDSKGKKTRKCEETLEISGSRFFKINPDQNTHFTTRLVSRNGCYSYNNASLEENTALLTKAGLIPHENCIPFLASSKANAKSKVDMELHRVEILEISLEKFYKRQSFVDFKKQLEDEARKIDEIRRPLFDKLNKKEKLFSLLNEYSKKFASCDDFHLRDMEMGQYEIIAVKKQPSRYGEQYRLILSIDGEWRLVWGNFAIKEFFNSLPVEETEKLKDPVTGFLAVYNKPLGILNITGRGMNKYGKTTVYCSVTLKDTSTGEALNELTTATQSSINEMETKIATCLSGPSLEVPCLPKEQLLNYTEYTNLSTLALGSVVQVNAIGFLSYYGIDRLIVITDKGAFQAGDDLEEKYQMIKKDSYLKILRTKLNKSRKKYAYCEIFDKKDWSVFVDYSKTPILSDFNGKNCIVDVKCVTIKGKKRKLLMSDEGKVFRMKKCKLENVIKPGYY